MTIRILEDGDYGSPSRIENHGIPWGNRAIRPGSPTPCPLQPKIKEY